jgi:hypothetical protein
MLVLHASGRTDLLEPVRADVFDAQMPTLVVAYLEVSSQSILLQHVPTYCFFCFQSARHYMMISRKTITGGMPCDSEDVRAAIAVIVSLAEPNSYRSIHTPPSLPALVQAPTLDLPSSSKLAHAGGGSSPAERRPAATDPTSASNLAPTEVEAPHESAAANVPAPQARAASGRVVIKLKLPRGPRQLPMPVAPTPAPTQPTRLPQPLPQPSERCKLGPQAHKCLAGSSVAIPMSTLPEQPQQPPLPPVQPPESTPSMKLHQYSELTKCLPRCRRICAVHLRDWHETENQPAARRASGSNIARCCRATCWLGTAFAAAK